MHDTLIYKIQKFSIHDGPGIRSTVFFKGCPLRCQWCHNPESLHFDKSPDKIGKEWSIEALVKELEKDRIFYEESNGGITLSGGEPMAQNMNYIVTLLSTLQEKGIHTTIDTCGDVPYENFEAVLPYTDLFLYDLKLWNDKNHLTYTKRSNKQILSNLSCLGQSGVNICLRLPLIAGLNDSLAEMNQIADWLEQENIRPNSISLLPYHQLGNNKYIQLGLKPPTSFNPPSEEHLDEIKTFLKSKGYKVAIGGGTEG